jgi:hypothetical protein
MERETGFEPATSTLGRLSPQFEIKRTRKRPWGDNSWSISNPITRESRQITPGSKGFQGDRICAKESS